MKSPDQKVIESETLILEMMKEARKEREAKAEEHEKLRNSEEYQKELTFLKKTVHDLIQTLKLSEVAASRWVHFTEHYLLPRHFDELVEAAITAQLAIENGALNPARRELRYMLEVAVNIAFVDEQKGKETFDEKIKFFKSKHVKKRNVDHIFELPLRLLPKHKAIFANSVRDAWVKATNYVHPTKRRMDEKLALREQGIIIGMESIEMMQSIVADVHEVCTIVMVLAFETIGPSFTGDLLVDNLDQFDDWLFNKSEFIALIDSYFDYKHERQHRLESHAERRQNLVKYWINQTDA